MTIVYIPKTFGGDFFYETDNGNRIGVMVDIKQKAFFPLGIKVNGPYAWPLYINKKYRAYKLVIPLKTEKKFVKIVSGYNKHYDSMFSQPAMFETRRKIKNIVTGLYKARRVPITGPNTTLDDGPNIRFST